MQLYLQIQYNHLDLFINISFRINYKRFLVWTMTKDQEFLKKAMLLLLSLELGPPSRLTNTGRTFTLKKKKNEVAIMVLLADGGGERLQKVLFFLIILIPWSGLPSDPLFPRKIQWVQWLWWYTISYTVWWMIGGGAGHFYIWFMTTWPPWRSFHSILRDGRCS